MTEEHRRIADRYRLDGVLGRGGMSVVHQGYDERLDRPVAIKLLRPHAVVDPDVPGAEEAREAQARDRPRPAPAEPTAVDAGPAR